jgi:hypothetical protein
VWDLAGQFPLGVQSVSVQVLQRAEELAQARGAVQVQGVVRVALRDLDLAQVEESDSEWVQGQEKAQVQGQVQVEEQVQEQVEGRESALPKGYRLDSEQGLVRDLVQVTELELG